MAATDVIIPVSRVAPAPGVDESDTEQEDGRHRRTMVTSIDETQRSDRMADELYERGWFGVIGALLHHLELLDIHR